MGAITRSAFSTDYAGDRPSRFLQPDFTTDRNDPGFSTGAATQ
jgi:hypothetical protein